MEEAVRNKHNTAIFSGRFDPPHIGHFFTIFDIAKRYNKVVVVVLDYPERELCSAQEAAGIFNIIFDSIYSNITRSKIDVVVNHLHFGKIKFSEYDLFIRNIGACYNHTVYLSGNPDVIKNMEKEQIKHEYVPRSMDRIYEGTRIRKYLNG